jgi:hypothetical protein
MNIITQENMDKLLLEKKLKRQETFTKSSKKYYLKNREKVIERVKQYNFKKLEIL